MMTRPPREWIPAVFFLAACTVLGCAFDPVPGQYAPCDADGLCPPGCRCMAGWICATDATDRPPWECNSEPIACVHDGDCRLGCTCQDQGCLPAPELSDRIDWDYCLAGEEPTCMTSDRLVANVTELAEALTWAATTPGPHRIRLETITDEDWVVTDQLPPLPGLTYLDGGGVSLVGDGSLPGLRVDGVGAIVSDLRLNSFGTYGLRVEADSQDVAMFRMRVENTGPGGDPNDPAGHGIHVMGQPGAPVRSVSIGRGRGLACIDPITVAQADSPSDLNAQHDVNVIVGNNGDGIRVEHSADVYIYGTWVGFDNLGHPIDGSAVRGNGGTGVRLNNVTEARVGAQQLLDSEAYGAEHSPLPGFVGIGGNQMAGLWIQGGGRIEAPGLIVGNAPTMAPWGENVGVGLRIENNQDYVYIGPAPHATGAAAMHFCEMYSDGAPMVELIGTQDEVWIRGMQFWSTGIRDYPRAGVEVIHAHAPVHLVHLTFGHDFAQAGVYVEELRSGGSVELRNSLFYKEAWGEIGQEVCIPPEVPVMSVVAGPDQVVDSILVRGNMAHCFPGWCVGDCANQELVNNLDFAPGTFGCTFFNALPLDPACPNVDAGEVIASPSGQPLHLVGTPDSPHVGCGPDIGFVECTRPACRSNPCQ